MRDIYRNVLAVIALLVIASSSCFADEVLRDPTRPYAANVPGKTITTRFMVNAIIISTERRVAIVNGRRVGVGASVHDATIVAIEKDHLVLERNGKRIVARLNDGASRR